MSILNSGPLATLLARLTSTRAGYLDAAISTRAAASTALSTAQWSNGRAANLDNLDIAVSAAGNKPPLTILNGVTFTQPSIYNVFGTSLTTYSASETAFDTWKTIHTVTGAGYIEDLRVGQAVGGNASSRDIQASLLIDGTEVWTSATNAWQTPTDDDKGFWLVARDTTGFSNAHVMWASNRIHFSTSWTLRFKKTENAAGTVTMKAQANWSTTA